MTMTREERAAARERWRVAIAEFRQSNQTVDSFCAERGLKYYSFKYWQKILNRESDPGVESETAKRPSFREIAQPTSTAAPYMVRLRSGRTLSISDNFLELSLRKLIEILESC